MTHYMIELALWILLLFIIGCAIGYLLRRLFGSKTPVAQERAVEPEPVKMMEPAAPAPVPEPVVETATVVETVAVSVPRMDRPRGLEEARGGKPDALQRISGIGPKNEKILLALGFFHFDQIAAWTPEQIAWIDDHLKFNGRIGREEWIEQARLLAAGEIDEFNARYGPKRK